MTQKIWYVVGSVQGCLTPHFGAWGLCLRQFLINDVQICRFSYGLTAVKSLVLAVQQQQQQHPLNGPLSGTTQVSWYQKGKTNLDLLEQETVSGIGIIWAIYKSAPCPRHITMPLSFVQARCPSCRPTNSIKSSNAKHWRQYSTS